MNLTLIENGLMPVYQTEAKEKIVNARELHMNLESGRKFADWVKDRIENYGFVEGQDFFTTLGKTPDGGRPRKDYFFTLDTGKEIAMVENNEQGRRIRKYFIDVEKKSRAMFAIPQNLPQALRMAADLAEQIDKQKPLVAFAETAAKSQDSILVRELAKVCCKNGIETGEKRLWSKLRNWGLIIPGRTEPYQQFIDRGYFEVAEGTFETSKGVRLHRTTRVTPKGQIYITSRLKKETA
jgi:anti-repressor protein